MFVRCVDHLLMTAYKRVICPHDYVHFLAVRVPQTNDQDQSPAKVANVMHVINQSFSVVNHATVHALRRHHHVYGVGKR